MSEQNIYEVDAADFIKQETLQQKPLESRRVFQLPIGFDYNEEWIKEVEFRDLTLADKNIKQDDPKAGTIPFRNIIRFGSYTSKQEIDYILLHKLCISDRVFCSLASRRTTHGDKYYTKLKCKMKTKKELEKEALEKECDVETLEAENGCGELNRDLLIDLGDFKFPVYEGTEGKSVFTVDLDLCGKSVKVKRSTVSSENLKTAFMKTIFKESEMIKLSEEEKLLKMNKELNYAIALLLSFIGCVIQIDDKEFNLEKMNVNSKEFENYKNLLLNLPDSDLLDLSATIKALEMEPDLSVEFECRHCGKECKEVFEFDPLFFTQNQPKVLKLK